MTKKIFMRLSGASFLAIPLVVFAHVPPLSCDYNIFQLGSMVGLQFLPLILFLILDAFVFYRLGWLPVQWWKRLLFILFPTLFLAVWFLSSFQYKVVIMSGTLSYAFTNYSIFIDDFLNVLPFICIIARFLVLHPMTVRTWKQWTIDTLTALLAAILSLTILIIMTGSFIDRAPNLLKLYHATDCRMWSTPLEHFHSERPGIF